MRALNLRMGALALFMTIGAGTASALPVAPLAATQDDPLVERVQLQCNAQRCLNPRTGAYTQSVCNRRGCRPSGGIVGYLGPQRGGYYRGRDRYDDRYDRRRYGYDRRYDRRYDRGYGPRRGEFNVQVVPVIPR